MTTTTPEVPGCSQPATIRIEIYRAADGHLHGSLDAALYVCDNHADAITDAITTAGLTPYRTPTSPGKRCGNGVSYTAEEVRFICVPNPVDMLTPYCAPVAGLPGVYRVRTVSGAEALIQRETDCWVVLHGFDPGAPVARHRDTLPAHLDLDGAARSAAQLLNRDDPRVITLPPLLATEAAR